MHCVILFGPPAVGKMTVGTELQRLTGLRLFHNHMSVDLALQFFPFGTPGFGRIVRDVRRCVFEEVAQSDLPGLIFTFVWAFDLESDKAFIDDMVKIFRIRGADVDFVELQASLDERLRRNETPFRLSEKRHMRDVEKSRARLLEMNEKYRFSTGGDFFYPERYLRLETDALAPEVVAQRIADHFHIPHAGEKPVA